MGSGCREKPRERGRNFLREKSGQGFVLDHAVWVDETGFLFPIGTCFFLPTLVAGGVLGSS